VEQIKAAAAERRVEPTTGATSHKKSVDDDKKMEYSSPNPAEAHMKSLKSRLAEKVAATQDQAPAPTPNQSQSSNYSEFF
jgi:hypothetical protein